MMVQRYTARISANFFRYRVLILEVKVAFKVVTPPRIEGFFDMTLRTVHPLIWLWPCVV
ncbi:hypothetical protein ACNKHR_12820 [Shigella flexneri]